MEIEVGKYGYIVMYGVVTVYKIVELHEKFAKVKLIPLFKGYFNLLGTYREYEYSVLKGFSSVDRECYNMLFTYLFKG